MDGGVAEVVWKAVVVTAWMGLCGVCRVGCGRLELCNCGGQDVLGLDEIVWWARQAGVPWVNVEVPPSPGGFKKKFKI